MREKIREWGVGREKLCEDAIERETKRVGLGKTEREDGGDNKRERREKKESK